MFYRRKILLTLLNEIGGSSNKTRLQKLLFLLCQKQSQPAYDFVPYKFGCFSFSANADLAALTKKGTVIESGGQWEYSGESYFEQLKVEDQENINLIQKQFLRSSNSELIRHTYIYFPFFAIFSEIKEKHLSPQDLKQVNQALPKKSSTTLFTIGYEGISLEGYLNKLIQNNVKMLVDVRKNPLSMKYGFSKNQLKRYCGSVNIKYIHIPEVGIESSKRKNLNSKNDYEALFKTYRSNELKNSGRAQDMILKLLKQEKRIALTCFEHDKDYCHRSHLAHKLVEKSGISNLVHL